MSARGRERDRNEERRVPRGNIHREDEEREEGQGCLSVRLADWNYDGGRFWILFFSKEDPFEYLLREGLVGGRGDP